MARDFPDPRLSFAPIRITLAVVLGFLALIVVLLVVRPNMMYGMVHQIMTMM